MSLTSSRSSASRSVNAPSRASAPNVNGFVCGIALCIIAYEMYACPHEAAPHTATRALGLDQDAAALDARRVDGRAKRRLVHAGAGLEIELPAVPWTPQNPAAGELVDPRAARHPLAHRAEAERPAVVRTAVADPVQGAARLRHDPYVTPRDARDHAPVALEVGRRAD